MLTAASFRILSGLSRLSQLEMHLCARERERTRVRRAWASARV
jgi:hypothetical protein